MTPADQSVEELDAWIASTARRALAYAVTLVGNPADAEDLVHDCYLRLLAKAADYDLPQDGTRLLFRSITRACVNFTQRRRPVVSLDAAPASVATSTGPDPGALAACRELKDAVRVAMSELPVSQRAVLELRSFGHSLIEIAGILDVSHANARMLLHRGRQTLASRLAPFLKEEAG